MKIKLDFTNWMKFAEAVNSSFFDAVNTVNIPKWEEIGIKEVFTDPNENLAKHFDVINKELFLLAVIQHSIEWSEIKD
jgi:hypothetical protein